MPADGVGGGFGLKLALFVGFFGRDVVGEVVRDFVNEGFCAGREVEIDFFVVSDHPLGGANFFDIHGETERFGIGDQELLKFRAVFLGFPDFEGGDLVAFGLGDIENVNDLEEKVIDRLFGFIFGFLLDPDGGQNGDAFFAFFDCAVEGVTPGAEAGNMRSAGENVPDEKLVIDRVMMEFCDGVEVGFDFLGELRFIDQAGQFFDSGVDGFLELSG